MKHFIFIVFFLCSSYADSIAQTCTSTSVELIINSGDWASEIAWSVTDEEGLLVDTMSSSYENNTEYVQTLCLLENSCYQFHLYDSYGDGWNGGTYQFLYEDGTYIDSGTLAASTSYGLSVFCIQDASSCEGNLLELQLETGIWAEEISWSLTDTLGDMIDSIGVTYSDNSAYSFPLCVADGCYSIHMYDSYGDGWQGASFQLINQDGESIVDGYLDNGFESQLVFSLNSDCNIPLCSDPAANNYNELLQEGEECVYISENVNLLSNWSDSSLGINGFGGSYTEVYGYENNGREYAIIGSTFGTHFIDVTNPNEVEELTRIAGAYSASNVTHRDYHIMGKYLYAVCDQGASSLQIMDVSNLPNSVEVVYDSDELFTRSHNIFIDTVSHKLYSCSTKGYDELNNYWTSSLCVYDLSNPVQPTLLHNMNEIIPNTHDIWVDNDTAFINCPGTGTLVWEFSGAPSQLSLFNSYPDFGTNHSGWKAGDIYVFAEENNGYDLKVVDASDISNLELLSTFNSNVNEFSIAHNLMIKDDLVYISYYWDGLQVYDISDPENPVRVAFYDTYEPENFGGYNGAWGVYAFLPSGNVLISDIANGLFVLEVELREQQEIELQDGWNMISTYLHDSNMTATTLVSSIEDSVVVVKNNIGSAYLPAWGFDGIGAVEYGQGYQLKINGNSVLIVDGLKQQESNITLNEGWNMIGVLSETPQNIESVLFSCIEDVIIAKDGYGVAYLPDWDFNGIGDMLPGQGYQVKMLSQAQINFEE